MFQVLIIPQVPILLQDPADEVLSGDGVIHVKVLFEELESFGMGLDIFETVLILIVDLPHNLNKRVLLPATGLMHGPPAGASVDRLVTWEALGDGLLQGHSQWG